MPRKGHVAKRDVLADPIYGSKVVTKLINNIMLDGKKVGGVILKINKETHHNELEILFVLPEEHTKGIGYGAWCAVEALHPETKVWETCTPYFEKRNIHFYVNKCGFQIVEFFGAFHEDPHPHGEEEPPTDEGPDEMFRFIKVMKEGNR